MAEENQTPDSGEVGATVETVHGGPGSGAARPGGRGRGGRGGERGGRGRREGGGAEAKSGGHEVVVERKPQLGEQPEASEAAAEGEPAQE